MLNKEQYLLTQLQEECAEVAQRASKAIRFGLNEKQPGQDKTNFDRLREEIVDLVTVVQYIQDTINQELLPGKNATNQAILEIAKMMAAKRAKMEKYMEYSIDIGVLESELENEEPNVFKIFRGQE